MKRRAKLLTKKLALSAAALATVLLVIEVAFRLLGVSGEFHQSRVDVVYRHPDAPREVLAHGFQPHSFIRSQYDSDPRGYFGPDKTIYHRFNSVGWRDGEHVTAKSPGTYRILGLGDSYLYGQGVRHEDLCLTRLQVLLSKTFRNVTIETINTGLSGANTAFQAELLRHRGLDYDPDLVIVHFVLNDVEKSLEALKQRGPRVEFVGNYLSIYDKPDVLSKYSNLWAWARQRYLRQVHGRAYLNQCLESFQRDSSKWAQCGRALSDIQRICQEHGARMLVVIFPFFVNLDEDYPFQPIHDVVRRFCESSGIDVIDLRDHYRDYNGPELWVHPTDQHPNEIAHGIAADTIADYITARPEHFRLPTAGARHHDGPE